jgi:outer membrane protein assembly factor BamB
VGSSNGALHAVSPDGEIAWQVMLSRPVVMAPVFLSDSALFAFGGRGDLYRFGL